MRFYFIILLFVALDLLLFGCFAPSTPGETVKSAVYGYVQCEPIQSYFDENSTVIGDLTAYHMACGLSTGSKAQVINYSTISENVNGDSAIVTFAYCVSAPYSGFEPACSSGNFQLVNKNGWKIKTGLTMPGDALARSRPANMTENGTSKVPSSPSQDVNSSPQMPPPKSELILFDNDTLLKSRGTDDGFNGPLIIITIKKSQISYMESSNTMAQSALSGMNIDVYEENTWVKSVGMDVIVAGKNASMIGAAADQFLAELQKTPSGIAFYSTKITEVSGKPTVKIVISSHATSEEIAAAEKISTAISANSTQ